MWEMTWLVNVVATTIFSCRLFYRKSVAHETVFTSHTQNQEKTCFTTEVKSVDHFPKFFKIWKFFIICPNSYLSNHISKWKRISFTVQMQWKIHCHFLKSIENCKRVEIWKNFQIVSISDVYFLRKKSFPRNFLSSNPIKSPFKRLTLRFAMRNSEIADWNWSLFKAVLLPKFEVVIIKWSNFVLGIKTGFFGIFSHDPQLFFRNLANGLIRIDFAEFQGSCKFDMS